MERFYNKGIIAMVPVYREGIGDCTTIYHEGGESLVEKSIRTVIVNLFDFKRISLSLTRKHCQSLLSSKNLIPLYLDANNILVPMKFREPLCKNDKAFGYINYSYYKSLKRLGDDRVEIEFLTGLTLKIQSKWRSARKHIEEGRIIQNNCTRIVCEDYSKYSVMEFKKTRRDYSKLISKIDQLRDEKGSDYIIIELL